MPSRKDLLNFTIIFWLVCFGFGVYIARNTNDSPSQEVSAETLQTASTIQQIDPIDIEAMMVETYANTTTSENYSNYIQLPNNEYSSCKVIDKNSITEINDPDNLLTFINKQHQIDLNYVPNDLVKLTDYGIPVLANISLRKTAAEKLLDMYNAIETAGFNVKISSGFRSSSHQQRVLDSWGRMVGTNAANGYAAMPGFSEHQLGTTVDLLTSENGYAASPSYFSTKTFNWLAANAYKYGFTLSYPQGMENFTGYNAEGWHYRYVGIDIATEIHNQNIYFIEYQYKRNGICIGY